MVFRIPLDRVVPREQRRVIEGLYLRLNLDGVRALHADFKGAEVVDHLNLALFIDQGCVTIHEYVYSFIGVLI
jgi:hypothetical protein